jgi:hypothetical protein
MSVAEGQPGCVGVWVGAAVDTCSSCALSCCGAASYAAGVVWAAASTACRREPSASRLRWSIAGYCDNFVHSDVRPATGVNSVTSNELSGACEEACPALAHPLGRRRRASPQLQVRACRAGARSDLWRHAISPLQYRRRDATRAFVSTALVGSGWVMRERGAVRGLA